MPNSTHQKNQLISQLKNSFRIFSTQLKWTFKYKNFLEILLFNFCVGGYKGCGGGFYQKTPEDKYVCQVLFILIMSEVSIAILHNKIWWHIVL